MILPSGRNPTLMMILSSGHDQALMMILSSGRDPASMIIISSDRDPAMMMILLSGAVIRLDDDPFNWGRDPDEFSRPEALRDAAVTLG